MVSRKKQKQMDYGWTESDHRDVEGTSRVAKPKAKKNTRKWCKGVEGREHKPEKMIPHNAGSYRWARGCEAGTRWSNKDKVWWFCSHKLICTVCKKVIEENTRCPDKPEQHADVPQMWLDT